MYVGGQIWKLMAKGLDSASPAYCVFIPNPPFMVLFLMLERLRLAGWPGYQLCHREHWRDTEEEGLFLLFGCAPTGGPRPEAVSQ